jgi:hypothetical protein
VAEHRESVTIMVAGIPALPEPAFGRSRNAARHDRDNPSATIPDQLPRSPQHRRLIGPTPKYG